MNEKQLKVRGKQNAIIELGLLESMQIRLHSYLVHNIGMRWGQMRNKEFISKWGLPVSIHTGYNLCMSKKTVGRSSIKKLLDHFQIPYEYDLNYFSTPLNEDHGE